MLYEVRITDNTGCNMFELCENKDRETATRIYNDAKDKLLNGKYTAFIEFEDVNGDKLMIRREDVHGIRLYSWPEEYDRVDRDIPCDACQAEVLVIDCSTPTVAEDDVEVETVDTPACDTPCEDAATPYVPEDGA